MELNARAHKIIAGINREFWYEENCWPEIESFFSLKVPDDKLSKQDRIRREAFRRTVERVIRNQHTRDMFEKECHGNQCIYSMKFFKGGQNTRIFCHYAQLNGKELFTFCALIPKKKSQALTAKDLNLVERIGKHTFIYIGIV